MFESLPCSPETITTLLISYTAIQDKKLKKKRKEGTSHMQMIIAGGGSV